MSAVCPGTNPAQEHNWATLGIASPIRFRL